MFSGAQLSLYPMSDDFVGIILTAVKALDPYRDRLRIETDDISTLVVGPPRLVVEASSALFLAAATTGTHTAMSALLSRGCPGEPDDPICQGGTVGTAQGDLSDRVQQTLAAISDAPVTGQTVTAQLSYYPLGDGAHMDEIYAVIDVLKAGGVHAGVKHFCTKLRGDAGPVFATITEVFAGFGGTDAHITIDLTVSANSPSQAA